MTFYFQGADLFLDGSKFFLSFEEKFCMLIVASPEPRVDLLGAFQQADNRFLFDVQAGRMSFVPENCRRN